MDASTNTMKRQHFLEKVTKSFRKGGKKFKNKKVNNNSTAQAPIIIERRDIRVVAWNVKKITNCKKLQREIEYLKIFNVIILMETWIEEKSRTRVENILPSNYNWKNLNAEKKCNKAKGSGGLLIGIKKQITAETKLERIDKVADLSVSDDEKWTIIGAYVHEQKEELWEYIEEEIHMQDKVMILGDMNARIGEKTGIIMQEERKSKDKTVNEEGNKLLEKIQEHGLWILNGDNPQGNKGEFTYKRKASTVIDYGLVKDENKNRVPMKIGQSTESDHEPLELQIKAEWKEKPQGEEKVKYIADWSENACKKYKEEIDQELKREQEMSYQEIKEVMKRTTKYKKCGPYVTAEEVWWDR